MTTGATGFSFTDICTRPSMGRFRWANNQKHAFAHVYVDEMEYTVKFMGINLSTQETTELYRVTIYNDQLA